MLYGGRRRQVSRKRGLVIGIGEDNEDLPTTHPNKAKRDLCLRATEDDLHQNRPIRTRYYSCAGSGNAEYLVDPTKQVVAMSQRFSVAGPGLFSGTCRVCGLQWGNGSRRKPFRDETLESHSWRFVI
jgi:hypothetical protein